jgi:hypothetical protein
MKLTACMYIRVMISYIRCAELIFKNIYSKKKNKKLTLTDRPIIVSLIFRSCYLLRAVAHYELLLIKSCNSLRAVNLQILMSYNSK